MLYVLKVGSSSIKREGRKYDLGEVLIGVYSPDLDLGSTHCTSDSIIHCTFDSTVSLIRTSWASGGVLRAARGARSHAWH